MNDNRMKEISLITPIVKLVHLENFCKYLVSKSFNENSSLREI